MIMNNIKLQNNVVLIEENTQKVIEHFEQVYNATEESHIREFIFKYFEIARGAMEFQYASETSTEVTGVSYSYVLSPTEEAMSKKWFEPTMVTLDKNEAGLAYYQVF